MNKVIIGFLLAVAALFFLLDRQQAVELPVVVVDENAAPDPYNASHFRKGDSRIDCGGAPADAVTNANLPEHLKGDVQIECWQHGHTLGAAYGHVWMTRIEEFGDIQVPLSLVLRAQIRTAEEIENKVLPVVNHAAYFTRIEKRVLSSAEAAPVLALWAEKNPQVEVSNVSEVMEILAVNQDAVEQRAYIANFTTGEQSGYLCTPECDAETLLSLIEWKTYAYYNDPPALDGSDLVAEDGESADGESIDSEPMESSATKAAQ